MKHYHGYWPVLAIIKQYLSNIKKRLARDLKAEHEDPGLPGSDESESQNMTPDVDEELGHDRDTSGHNIRNKNDLKKAASKKTKRRRLNDSGKAFREEEFEDTESEFEVEESDEDEVEVDHEDQTDPEDDEAEMEIYQYYGGALDSNSKQDDDDGDEGHKHNNMEVQPVEKSVEYTPLLIYSSLT